MVRLNLMPWRERRRHRLVRRFQMALVASLMLTLAGLLVIDQLARARLAQQVATTALYQAQLKALDDEHATVVALRGEREAVQAQQAALAQLRPGQLKPLTLLQGLERAMPSAARLTELGLQDGRLRLAGLAASAAVVAQLMRDLQALEVVTDLELVYLRNQAAGDEFLITAQLPADWS